MNSQCLIRHVSLIGPRTEPWGTYWILDSGVGRSPIVVNVRVDQYTEARYFLDKFLKSAPVEKNDLLNNTLESTFINT